MAKKPLEIKIKYHGDGLLKIEKIEVGDWIDLRAAERVDLIPGKYYEISLGVSMQLPDGYEAHIVPRSSSFSRWGILSANSVGIIDGSYCGNGDIWHFPIIATRSATIFTNDRICQFRIMSKMPDVTFSEVEHLEGCNRGGFGSTGRR